MQKLKRGKKLTKAIQHYIKKIIDLEQAGFILGLECNVD